MFWSLVLEPGKLYAKTVENAFHISAAVLDPTSSGNDIVRVMLESDGKETILCNLGAKQGIYQVPLDLNFMEGSSIAFYTAGEKSTVHLSGYHVTPELGESDEEGEEEEESEEEEPEVVSISSKRKKGSEKITHQKRAKILTSDNEVKPVDKVEVKKVKTTDKSKEFGDKKSNKKTKTIMDISMSEGDDDEDFTVDDTLTAMLDEDLGEEEEVEDEEEEEEKDGEDESDDDSEDEQDGEEMDEDDSEEEEEEGEEEEEDEEAEEEKAAVTPEKGPKFSAKVTPEASVEKQKRRRRRNKKGSAISVQESKELSSKNTVSSQEKKLGQMLDDKTKLNRTGEEKRKSIQSSKDKPSQKLTPKEKSKFASNAKDKSTLGPATKDKLKTMVNGDAPKQKKLEGKITPISGHVGGQENKQPESKYVRLGGVFCEEFEIGDGMTATNGKMVHVYFEGKLKETGEVFDKVVEGKPFSFRLGLGEVLRGWDVGLAGMKVGGRRRITCPPNMAYGKKGMPPKIPPRATLVFDITLKDVK